MDIYKKALIYILKSNNTNLVYIGSTSRTCYKRFCGHKQQYAQYLKGDGQKYVSSFEIFKNGDCYIEKIEEFKNISKNELRKKEGDYIKKYVDAVNKNIAGRTDEEYAIYYKKKRVEIDRKRYIKNKDKFHEYYEKNKENILKHRHDNYLKNKIDINKKRYEKIPCNCGMEYTKSHKSRHFKTNFHLLNFTI